jgi:hypothetical protein
VDNKNVYFVRSLVLIIFKLVMQFMYWYGRQFHIFTLSFPITSILLIFKKKKKKRKEYFAVIQFTHFLNCDCCFIQVNTNTDLISIFYTRFIVGICGSIRSDFTLSWNIAEYVSISSRRSPIPSWRPTQLVLNLIVMNSRFD